MKKKGFTLIELLVVIAIIAMLMAILMPALTKVKKIAARVVCGTNLKGLGTAQMVYSQDYDDEYVVQGRGYEHQWVRETPGFQSLAKDWSVTTAGKTVASSLYLLVRQADVSPKSFVCPSSDETEYDGRNDNNLDIVDLWDFGAETYCVGSGYPDQHVSYSYQQPYSATGGKSRYAADATRSAAFAVMADRNPCYDAGTTVFGGLNVDTWLDGVGRMENWFTSGSAVSESSWQVQQANSRAHDRESQNVLFADGHTANEKTVDVGVKNDNIYMPRGGGGTPEEQIRLGYFGQMSAPAFNLAIQPGMDPQQSGSDDSVLVNDGSPGY